MKQIAYFSMLPPSFMLEMAKKTRFWHHSWLDGEAPKNLAPHLFELVRRKK
jgi:hypothetical protein